MATAEQEVVSVAELVRRLRRAVERTSGPEWIEGEVASLRRAASGHVYFVLKDEREDAVVECVMYKLQATRARQHLSDGARVQLFGRATVWAPRGRLQLVAEVARPAGRGALLAALEQLKDRLRIEGLFDATRKRPLPKEPRVIGVVTSRHGAALHDIVTVAFRRGRARIVLCPAVVQGDGAVPSLLSAIDRIEGYPGLDVLIVGRGGGSGEDLMAFNDERVVRRIAAVSVPVVSAVGHEVDVTLTDLVADVRAATPSHAAELVVPDLRARAEVLSRCRIALVRAMHARILADRHDLGRLQARVSDPRFVISDKQQHLDELAVRLERATLRGLSRRRLSVDRLHPRLMARHPRAVLARAKGDLVPLDMRLQSAMKARVGAARGSLAQATIELDALSPLRVLGRGYAIATRKDGQALLRSTDVRVGEAIEVRLHEGKLEATVSGTDEGS